MAQTSICSTNRCNNGCYFPTYLRDPVCSHAAERSPADWWVRNIVLPSYMNHLSCFMSLIVTCMIQFQYHLSCNFFITSTVWPNFRQYHLSRNFLFTVCTPFQAVSSFTYFLLLIFWANFSQYQFLCHSLFTVWPNFSQYHLSRNFFFTFGSIWASINFHTNPCLLFSPISDSVIFYDIAFQTSE